MHVHTHTPTSCRGNRNSSPLPYFLLPSVSVEQYSFFPPLPLSSSLAPSALLPLSLIFLPLSPSISLALFCTLFSLCPNIHNVPHLSCSALLLCSMQTSCKESTSDIIPLSLRCHLHHGAWSPGRGEAEAEGVMRTVFLLYWASYKHQGADVSRWPLVELQPQIPAAQKGFFP